MAKSKMKKDKMGMMGHGKPGNLPDQVIMREYAAGTYPTFEYENTVSALDRQMSDDVRMMMRNKAKDQY
jgi:hypothetical protein